MKIKLHGLFGLGIMLTLLVLKLSVWIGLFYVAFHMIHKYW